jgi:ubiquinone/menaquinone biosynthesis C-methylase UbiE
MPDRKHHLCPWWMGYFLASPLRRLYQNPEKITGRYIREGMRVLEIGPGMGFFTLPMARMTGGKGKIYCVDIQQKMLNALRRRAIKNRLADRIECRLCSDVSLGINDLAGTIDQCMAIAVVHEVPDIRALFREIRTCLKKDAKVFVAEPEKRVTTDEFNATLAVAADNGLALYSNPQIRGFRCALLAVKREEPSHNKK